MKTTTTIQFQPGKPVSKPDIATVENAAEYLGVMVLMNSEIEKHQAEAEAAIAKIKEGFAQKTGHLAKGIEAIEGALEGFAKKQKKKLFTVERSLKLECGIIGFRESTSIEISDKTLPLLEKKKLADLITITKAVNKAALAKLSDKELAKVAATRKTEDSFYVKLIKAKTPVGKAKPKARAAK